MLLRFNADRLSFNALRRCFSMNTSTRIPLLLMVAPFLFAGTLVAQSPSDETILGADKQIERPLAAGQVHTYRLTLAADQYLHVIVVQHGIDVVVKLSGPDGGQLVETDSLNGTQGPEHLFWIADEGGTYRLEVCPLNRPMDAGRYEVRIEESRTAKDQDKQRINAETLFSEANLLRNAGAKESLRKAVGKFAEAATHFQSLNDTQRTVSMLNFIGFSYTSLGENPRAINSFTQAFALAHATSDQSGEGVALTGLGTIYGLGEPQKGLESFSRALSLFRAIGDSTNQAGALVGIGLVSLRSGDLQKARESYSQALPLARAVGERGLEARSLAGLGYVYRRSGEKQSGLDSFNEALPIARLIGDRVSEADALTGLGLIHTDLGEAQKGLNYLLESLPVWRAVGDRGGEAVTLNGMGQAYGRLVDKEKSLESFTQALPLARAVGDRSSEAMALIGIGFIDATLGEAQKGLDLLRQALSIARDTGDRQNEADALIAQGYAYGRTGETQKAIESFNESLPILRSVGDRSGEAAALVLLGFVYLGGIDLAKLNIADFFKAQDSFTQALTIAREIGNPMIEAQALNGLSVFSLDNPQKARDYLTQSLSLSRKAGNRGIEADALNDLGFSYFLSNEPQKAIESFSQGLNLYRAFNDRHAEATALMNLALVERSVKQLTEARAHTEAAIAIVESLRVKIVNQEGRKSYFSSAQDYYKFYIDLLMLQHDLDPSAGHDGEALQANERSRARALLDTLNEAKADITQGVDPQLLEREHSLQQRLNSMAQDQMKLLSGKHTEAEADALATELSVLTTSHEQVKTTIRQSSPNYAALTQPQPLTLKEIQTQVLDADTLLLEYSLGSVNSFLWNEDTDEDSYLWAVTSDSIQGYELAGRSEIEAGARQLYDLLNARNKRHDGETLQQREERISKADAEIPKGAAKLSQLILAPVATQLGKKRLVIVADGILEYIPFAMLPAPSANPDSSTPLIVDHEIVNLPSASILPVMRREVEKRKPARKAIVALADPVFMINDERVTSALKKWNRIARAGTTPATTPQTDLPAAAGTEKVRELQLIEAAEDTGVSSGGLYVRRLPDSRKEAQEIVAMVAPGQRKLALDFEASRVVATSADLSQYRYVHFSTHGLLNSVHPELSGIVLSLVNERGEAQDGFLRAHEIFNLKLPAELVVLSACQTGIGKSVRGEGLMSLTRGFMYAGAPRVVVSLWSVSELGTTELMVRFYRGMLKEGLRPAAALREAQISLMKEKRWSSPFYWAPFTLQGEWR